MTKICSSSTDFLVELAQRPSTILSMISPACRTAAACSARIARSRSTRRLVDCVRRQRLRVGGGDMHRELLAERRQLAPCRRSNSSATSTPILPRPGAAGIVDVGRDHAVRRPLSCAVRRSSMFSPIVATNCVSSSATVWPLAGQLAWPSSASRSPLAVERQLGRRRDEVLELLVAGDEVGLGS